MRFDWDEANITPIQSHRLEPHEVVEALANSPIPLSTQEVGEEVRYLVAGQTDSGQWCASYGRFEMERSAPSRPMSLGSCESYSGDNHGQETPPLQE